MSKKTIQVSHSNFFVEKIRRTTKYEMPSYHMHDDYEIFYLIEGERKYFINDTIYKISPGNLILVDMSEIHKTDDFSDYCHERIVLNFTSALLSEFSSTINKLDLYSCFKSKNRVLPLSFKYKNNIEALLNKLLETNDSKNPSKDFYIKILICELLIIINDFIRDFKLKDYNSTQTINSKVSQVIKYITENFHQNITLSSVAKEFYISPFYLSKLFKQTTNFTFVEYLNSIRIKNSKELLKNTNYKIIDIAEKVGFSNNTHFTRVFKIIVGMSPMKFRKLHTEK
jgi:AraC-like DNA-binding protein